MTEPALLQRLADSNPRLHTRLDELRATVSEWLGYIPATFPHYTRHSIVHSEEIIKQLSSLIFVDADPAQPVSAFSDMELYVLAASAYLHDAGMVASDAEKQELLASSGWAEWIGEGPAATRWIEIDDLRSRAEESEEEAPRLHFAADLQTRFLIADFIRRTHHIRVIELMRDEAALMASADLGDPSLRKTIVDVCIAHGLARAELAIDERYPSRRDIQGSPVDVRLVAILLRLGDLLDLSHDRACPLLLNAASPLPPGSIAHWKQYRRIVHRVTSPDRLELRAECDTQEEHRLLRDWCQWIEDETRDAQFLLRRSDRHQTWKPPTAQLGEPDPTFVIVPSAKAKYVPVDWRIESDPATVLGRFASDIYSSDLAFLRELLQNALDASRCRIIAERGPESMTDGWWTPDALDACEQYPIEVRLESRPERNDDSGLQEVKQVISVSDQGIGMNADRVQQYLLHAGRSFYDSPAFRKSYGFVAASRFGVGFLSVFGVSDRVEVLTRALESTDETGLRLELQGPRNYVLVESRRLETVGTKIDVELREKVDPETLGRVLTMWCTRSEFPIMFTVDGESRTIRHEDPSQFESRVEVNSAGVSALEVRAFPISSSIARGELYVLQQLNEDGRMRWDVESFELRRWVEENVPMLPLVPEAPRPMLALHGIAAPAGGGEAMTVRVDVRASQAQRRLNLSRDTQFESLPAADLGLDAEIERVLGEHFTEFPHDRHYKARVLSSLSVPWRISARIPGMAKVWKQGRSELRSWSELAAEPELWIAYGEGWPEAKLTSEAVGGVAEARCLLERTEIRWPRHRYSEEQLRVHPREFRWGPERTWFALRCETSMGERQDLSTAIASSGDCFDIGEIAVAFGISDGSLETFMLNRDHPLISGLIAASSREVEIGDHIPVNWVRMGSEPMEVLDLFLAGVRSAVSHRSGRRGPSEITTAMTPFVQAAGYGHGKVRLTLRPHSHYLVSVYGSGFLPERGLSVV